MGYRPAALSILPLLLVSPALAQDQNDPVFNLPRSTQPAPDTSRQGPELDVFRGGPVTVTPPPPVVAAPAPSPSPSPPSSQEAAPQASSPEAPATSRLDRPATRPAREAPASAPSPEPLTSSPAVAPAPVTPAASPTPEPAPPPKQASAGTQAGPDIWPWLLGGLLALGALTAVWLLRRRKSSQEEPWDEPTSQPGEEAPSPTTPAPRSGQAPTPAKPASPPAAAPPPPQPVSTDRAWIDLGMEVRSARLSLMGATIHYALTLHNRGPRPAEDLLIRSLIANADAAQQAMLQQFFAGSAGLPTHSVVSIAPGERQSLMGELRLLPDQIAAVQMGGRALLIPLIAFDVQYRWGEADGATGAGRTGRAFIVGQEQSPPADRLSPFRLDLGPRQYQTPGSRATALQLAS